MSEQKELKMTKHEQEELQEYAGMVKAQC